LFLVGKRGVPPSLLLINYAISRITNSISEKKVGVHTFYSIYGSNFRLTVKFWTAGKPSVVLLVKDKTKPMYRELPNFNQSVAHSPQLAHQRTFD